MICDTDDDAMRFDFLVNGLDTTPYHLPFSILS